MKEEEGGARYMSPLVKQDLAKLEKDGESRRVALDALKHFVENLEPSCVPRFLAQVSESKETGGSSRSYAISLYEEVARVHGKLIIPQMGRVMATVVRSLSASGSSPQLHQACAKVVSAMVRYSIDLETSGAEAEEILREVSRPLVEVLAGKLEPVAAGAATCMQALVESEKWKHASADLVSEVCHRTTTALGDKSTRTVAHLQLARSLATINPGTLNVYGACLLHAGEEVLNASANSWQHRKCAAKMVQAVMAIVDRETLALEVTLIMQVLESCRHDRMPHVRTAVCDALQTAKMLLTGDTLRDTDEGAGAKASEHVRVTPRRRNWSSNKYSPSSQESYRVSFTPTAASDSEASLRDPFSTPGVDSTGRMKRCPLFPSRGDIHSPLSIAPALALGPPSKHDAVPHNLDAKEYVPSQMVGGNTCEDVSGLLGDDAWMGKLDRPSVPARGSHIHLPTSLHHKLGGDKAAAGFQQNEEEVFEEKDFTPVGITQEHRKGETVSHFSPLEAMITRSFGEAEGDLMAEDEDILSGGSTELEGRLWGKSGMSIRGSSRRPIAGRHLRQESQTPESMVHSEFVQSNTISHRSMGSNYSDANDTALFGKKGSDQSSLNSLKGSGFDEAENRKIPQVVGATGNSHVGDHHAGISHAQYMKLANLSNNPEDGFSALKPRVLITAADFLPFTTPRRLVRSLQTESPDLKSNEVGKEDSVRLEEDESGEAAEFNGDADMDVESSSDAGWSVRDNPIASDESFRTEDSSEDDFEERPREVHETLAFPRTVLSVAGVSPVKPCGSPGVHQKSRSLDTGLLHAQTPTNVERRSNQGDDIGTYRLTPKVVRSPAENPDAELVCTSCTASQRKKSALKAEEWDLGMDINRPSDDQKTGARRSMLFEQEPQEEAGKPCSQGSEASVMGSIDEADRGSQGTSEINSGVASWWRRKLDRSSLLRTARRMNSLAEAVLGGSVCVVLAVPLAMVLARTLHTQPDYFLVPT